MPLTNDQVKAAISSGVLDNRMFSIYLFLKQLITRPNQPSTDTMYRVYNYNTSAYITTVEGLLVAIDADSLEVGYDFLDTYGTDRVHAFYAIPGNLEVQLKTVTDDNVFLERYAYSKHIRFSMAYLNDGADDSVPLKVVDISLCS